MSEGTALLLSVVVGLAFVAFVLWLGLRLLTSWVFWAVAAVVVIAVLAYQQPIVWRAA